MKDLEVCKNCTFYNEDKTYPGTGFCTLFKDYVRENESCADFEGE